MGGNGIQRGREDQGGMRRIRSYVLRSGRMTNLQRRALEELSNRYVLPYSQGYLDFKACFGNSNPVVMEIGFGNGEAVIEIARVKSGCNFLGVEVYPPGIGKLLHDIEEFRLANLLVIRHDAAEVLPAMIADRSLEGVHIFFPDPWPKKRHHKRRLISRAFLEAAYRKLRRGGYLYIVTDWEEYADEINSSLKNVHGFKHIPPELRPETAWRPETRFERKGRLKSHKNFEILVRLS